MGRRSLKRTMALAGLMASAAASAQAGSPRDDGLCAWEAVAQAIEQPLCGLRGDAARGRQLAADAGGGNCIACHRLPLPEEPFHGTIGPSLEGVASRYSAAQLRLRVVDQQQLNPFSIMPGFYRDPTLANRVADAYWGKTMLDAQAVEDLVAYLVTLR